MWPKLLQLKQPPAPPGPFLWCSPKKTDNQMGWGQVRSLRITVHIPITLRHQGGRKQVVTPRGAAPWIPTPSRVDNTIIKVIVRAHRWRDMLESGSHATVRDLAKAEAINESYLGRILRLTLLSHPHRGHSRRKAASCPGTRRPPQAIYCRVGQATRDADRKLTHRSASPPTADIRRQRFDVRFVPCPDVGSR
jgi:hypothetical protein